MNGELNYGHYFRIPKESPFSFTIHNEFMLLFVCVECIHNIRSMLANAFFQLTSDYIDFQIKVILKECMTRALMYSIILYFLLSLNWYRTIYFYIAFYEVRYGDL